MHRLALWFYFYSYFFFSLPVINIIPLSGQEYWQSLIVTHLGSRYFG